MSIPEELEGKYILLSARATREKDGRCSAFCDELGIATCSDSKEGALGRLQNTVKLILTKATERGDILSLLESRSIRLCPLEGPRVTGIPMTGEPGLGSHDWLRAVGDFSIGTTTHSGYIPLTRSKTRSKGLVVG